MYLLAVFLSVQISVSTPWVGVELNVSNVTGDVIVSSVEPNSPAAGIITENEIITSVSGAMRRVEVNDFLINEMPFNLKTYKEFNYFFSLQGNVSRLLDGKNIVFETSEGSSREIQPAPARPIS